MKLLLIHSDFIEYEMKKPAGKFAEEVPEDRRKQRMEECLSVLISVEKSEEGKEAQAVAQAAAEIRNVAGQVKTKRVMLYPYAHLSRDLGSPNTAKSIFIELEKELAKDMEVKRSPFGWYKSFVLHCKGHPLSELSRSIVPGQEAVKSHSVAEAGKAMVAMPPNVTPAHASEERVSEAVQKETQLRSEWFILSPDGTLTPGDRFDFKGHDDLKKFYSYESAKVRTSMIEAPHIKLMQELELVDYEPGSDSGNMRWYPKGQLVKRLLEAHCRNIVHKAGAMEVETPIMYDIQHPALSKYLNRFPARQYRIIADDREFFLRFSACFGQYLIMADSTISYRHLPMKVFELTHYSFRREQRGELTGIKRLRAFTMPDMHTLCADIDQAREEFGRHFDLAQGWMQDVGLPFEAGIRIVRDFYEQNKDFYTGLAKKMGKPVLIELWKDRFFYFVTKFEFNVVDAVDKAAALSTVQIDVENSERFGIHFTDKDGSRKHPLLLHTSVSGSVDRNLYVLLEREWLKMQKGEKPMLPYWLSPTQVRILPVNDEFMDDAKKLRSLFRSKSRSGVRVDIDDRVEGISRKIRDAEKDWVPIIVVIGEKEKASGQFQPRIRRNELLGPHGKPKEGTAYSLDQLVEISDDNMANKPFLDMTLSEYMSMRPPFRR
ncbi:MAG TPA: threonine--tRNA ligase [Candidatus Thermoplasmatota archaeon]|nr:threonine--tRNA ligase [Candidatus Thermoplasmatota archaeon]